MNKSDIKTIVKTAVSLFIICAVAAGLLAFINTVTSPIISENNGKTAEEARRQLLPEATEFEEKSTNDGIVYYIGKNETGIIGYVFTTSASGYGGEIELMTGINSDGTVSGISILTINETPGLGMNTNKKSFLDKYVGNTGPFSVVKNKTPEKNEIAAITSATISSTAVTNAVNEAVTLYNIVKEG